jgi:hypothetical protein
MKAILFFNPQAVHISKVALNTLLQSDLKAMLMIGWYILCHNAEYQA